jgi:hypothetical protein
VQARLLHHHHARHIQSGISIVISLVTHHHVDRRPVHRRESQGTCPSWLHRQLRPQPSLSSLSLSSRSQAQAQATPCQATSPKPPPARRHRRPSNVSAPLLQRKPRPPAACCRTQALHAQKFSPSTPTMTLPPPSRPATRQPQIVEKRHGRQRRDGGAEPSRADALAPAACCRRKANRARERKKPQHHQHRRRSAPMRAKAVAAAADTDDPVNCGHRRPPPRGPAAAHGGAACAQAATAAKAAFKYCAQRSHTRREPCERRARATA